MESMDGYPPLMDLNTASMRQLQAVLDEHQTKSSFSCQAYFNANQFQQIAVYNLIGYEAISKPYWFCFDVLIPNTLSPRTVNQELLLKFISLELHDEMGGIRLIAGYCDYCFVKFDGFNHQTRLRMLMRPRLYLLSKITQPKVYVDLTLQELINLLLIETKIYREDQIVWHSGHNFSVREQVMQTQYETQLEFFERQLNHAGLLYLIQCNADGEEELHIYPHSSLLPQAGKNTYAYSKNNAMHRQICNAKNHMVAFDELMPVYQVAHKEINVDDFDIEQSKNHQYQSNYASLSEKSKRYQDFYGTMNHDHYACHREARLRAEYEACNQYYVLARGGIASLELCQLRLDADDYELAKLSGDYLICEIYHSLGQGNNAFEQVRRSYWHQIKLVPSDCDYRTKFMTMPKTFELMSAIIEGQVPGQAYLNQKGQYRIRYHFDRSHSENAQASAWVSRLSPYVSQSLGKGNSWHTPLKPGTEVIVANIQSNPDRPVIVGAVANANQPNSITSHNRFQNRLQTKFGHSLMMDDTPSNVSLSVKHKANSTSLSMIKSQKHDCRYELYSQAQTLIQAKHQIRFSSHLDTLEEIERDYESCSSQYNYTVKHNLKYHAHNAKYVSKEYLVFDSGKLLSVYSKQKLISNITRDIHLNVLGKHCRIKAREGDVHINVGKNILFQGTGQSDIEIRSGNTCVRIHSSGDITIQSPEISLTAIQEVIIRGNSNLKQP